MNRIIDWDNDNPHCIVCGDKPLREIEVQFKGERHSGAVCERCNAVYLEKDEQALFAGFLPKEQWFSVCTAGKEDTIVINVAESPNPLLN